MANDDDYDFSGVSQRGLSDIESSLLSQWRAQNDDEEDDDDSYFCKHVHAVAENVIVRDIWLWRRAMVNPRHAGV